jgi:leucyl aminopeptidase
VYETIRAATKPHGETDINVVFIFADKTLHLADQDFDARTDRRISAAIKRNDVKGDTGEFTVTHGKDETLLGVLGLGKQADFNAEKARAAAAGLVKGLYRLHIRRAELWIHPDGPLAAEPEKIGRAFGEGLGLGNFKFGEFKNPSVDTEQAKALSVATNSAAFSAGLSAGLLLAESANFARRLAATPPNLATTTRIVEEARKLAESAGNITCSVLSGKQLLKHKLVGLDNVGKASEHPPYLIELAYTPKTPKFTLLLIGKTLCYDTGGLSIKPRDGMRGMKYDKCGGMAVLGAMQAVARIKPNFRVVGLLPTAENSIAQNALRVDDIIQYPNGVSVEVTNTDAEGRLVLADALVYGVRKYRPAAVLDLATLTGGVVVGLGRTYAGYFCEDAALRQRLEAAAEATGERVWRLPLHDEYKELMKAKHADIWNSAPVRDAHPIQGAAFLSYFVDAKLPWAHIDIAGTADIEKDRAPFCAGATGYGVRLLASLIENWK